MTHRDLTPYLHDLTLDRAAQADALAFVGTLRPNGPAERLEDILMSTTLFIADYPGPRLPSAQSAALDALTAAMSGLYALLEQSPDRQGWSVLATARMWMTRRAHEASTGLPYDLVATFLPMSRADDLCTWRNRAALTCSEIQAGAYAGWVTVLRLLEAIPHLEDGYIEGEIHSLLTSLGDPATHVN